LRDGVKFHDGSLLTAAAVKGSFERIVEPKLKAGAVVSLIGPLDTITAPNDSTVVFTFKQPYPAFMLQIWRYFFGILSPKYLATLKPGDPAAEPVGSGPFMFAGRSPDGVVTLKANPDYAWGTELFKNRARPYLDQIKFRAITEPSTRVATLESGENLLIDEIAEADYARLKEDKRFTFVLSPRASHTLGFSMNVTKAPTDDRAVREAVNWAIDRKSIVERVFFGVHHLSVGPLSEGVWARDESIEKTFSFDPARARKVLDDAGWKLGSGPIRQKAGQNLEMLLATFRSPWTEIGQAMQSMLRDVGVDLKVQVMERGPYLDLVRSYKHNLAATSSTAVDPDGILRVCYHSANRVSGSNFSNLNDPQLDALLVKGQGQELGTAERRQTYVDAQKRVMEILPFVGVMSQVRVEAMSTKVHDFKPGPDGLTGTAMNDAWVET
jgi:peptide/nickel transport system substrate-binding protein